VTRQPLRLLAVDLKRAGPDLRRALVLETRALDDLLGRVRSEHGSVELVIVSDTERFELYSTDANHVTVFRFVLRELLQRAGSSKELGDLPTISATGVAVAEHLFRFAAGFGTVPGLDLLGKLNLAIARSRDAGTLGAELSALFAGAVECGWRVYCETAVSDPTKSRPGATSPRSRPSGSSTKRSSPGKRAENALSHGALLCSTRVTTVATAAHRDLRRRATRLRGSRRQSFISGSSSSGRLRYSSSGGRMSAPAALVTALLVGVHAGKVNIVRTFTVQGYSWLN